MKNLIYYFSSTGNSLAAARAIANELDAAEIGSIPESIGETVPAEIERVGIIFPVYMWGPPLIVNRFLEQIEFKGNPYLFAVATYGGMPGNAIGLAEKKLHRDHEDRFFSAGFAVQMPGNYTPLYGAPSNEKQQKMFKRFHNRLPSLIETIQLKKRHRLERSNPLISLAGSGFYRLGSSRIPSMDKEFWVTEKCKGCGVCARVCPVKNIEIKEGRPQWQHHCEHCLACLQWCPQQAIQHGKRTVGRARYHHPKAEISDFLN